MNICRRKFQNLLVQKHRSCTVSFAMSTGSKIPSFFPHTPQSRASGTNNTTEQQIFTILLMTYSNG